MPSERPSRREWTGPKMGEGYSTVDIGPYVLLSPPAGGGQGSSACKCTALRANGHPSAPFFPPRAAAAGGNLRRGGGKAAALSGKTCSTFPEKRQRFFPKDAALPAAGCRGADGGVGRGGLRGTGKLRTFASESAGPVGVGGFILIGKKDVSSVSSAIELRNFEKKPGRDGNGSVRVGCILLCAGPRAGPALVRYHLDVGWLRVAYPRERQCEGRKMG